MVVPVTPFDVAPPLLRVKWAMHGAAYGDANCPALAVHGVPLTVVPLPTAAEPEAG